MPAGSAQKTTFSGSSAPFQINRGIKDLVNKGEEDGPASIQNEESSQQGYDQQRPVCRLQTGLMMGPQTFGMDAFETRMERRAVAVDRASARGTVYRAEGAPRHDA